VGYTAHAVLEGLAKAGQEPGSLDASVELLLPILDAELFGEVSEAKEHSNFAAAYKEAKKCRAYEAYQLLAAGVTFGESVELLLGLVRERLHEAGSPKVGAPGSPGAASSC
jgi:U3 small nucleolar RNA-associated protein 20